MKKGPSLCGTGIGTTCYGCAFKGRSGSDGGRGRDATDLTANHQPGNVYLLGTFSGMEIIVMGMLLFSVKHTYCNLEELTLEVGAMVPN